MCKGDPQKTDDTASEANALCAVLEVSERDEPGGSGYNANPGDPESYAVLREYFHDTAHFADLMNAFFFRRRNEGIAGSAV